MLERTSCVFCDSHLKDSSMKPQLLPCLHRACQSCVENTLQEYAKNGYNPGGNSVGVCSQCHQMFARSDVIDDIFLLEQISVYEGPRCTSCDYKNPAPGYCDTCKDWLCKDCVIAHYRIKVTKDHIVKHIDDISRSIVPTIRRVFCPKHTHEECSLYCITCNILTCKDCQLEDHKAHSFDTINVAAENIRNSLSIAAKKLGAKLQEVEAVKDDIENQMKSVQKSQEEAENDVKRQLERLALEVERRRDALLHELRQSSHLRLHLAKLNQCKREMQMLTESYQTCYKIVLHAIRKAQETSLAYCKSLMEKQVNYLSSLNTESEMANSPPLIFGVRFTNIGELLSHIRGLNITCNIGSEPLNSNAPGYFQFPQNTGHSYVPPVPTVSATSNFSPLSTPNLNNRVPPNNGISGTFIPPSIFTSSSSSSIPSIPLGIPNVERTIFTQSNSSGIAVSRSSDTLTSSALYAITNMLAGSNYSSVPQRNSNIPQNQQNHQIVHSNNNQEFPRPHFTCNSDSIPMHVGRNFRMPLANSQNWMENNFASLPRNPVPDVSLSNLITCQSTESVPTLSNVQETLNQGDQSVSDNRICTSVNGNTQTDDSFVIAQAEAVPPANIVNANLVSTVTSQSPVNGASENEVTSANIDISISESVMVPTELQNCPRNDSSNQNDVRDLTGNENEEQICPSVQEHTSSPLRDEQSEDRVCEATNSATTETEPENLSVNTPNDRPVTEDYTGRLSPDVTKDNNTHATPVEACVNSGHGVQSSVYSSEIDNPDVSNSSEPISTEDTQINDKNDRQDEGIYEKSDLTTEDDVNKSNTEKSAEKELEEVEDLTSNSNDESSNMKTPEKAMEEPGDITSSSNKESSNMEKSPEKAIEELEVTSNSNESSNMKSPEKAIEELEDVTLNSNDSSNMKSPEKAMEELDVTLNVDNDSSNMENSVEEAMEEVEDVVTSNANNEDSNVALQNRVSSQVQPIIEDCDDEIACSICDKDCGILVCCSVCSRVYHEECYVHPLSSCSDWCCLLCTDTQTTDVPSKWKRRDVCTLNGQDLLKCQRLLLELCVYNVAPFRGEVRSILNFKDLKKRISSSTFIPYEEPAEFIEDIKLTLEKYQQRYEVGSKEYLAIWKIQYYFLNDLLCVYYPDIKPSQSPVKFKKHGRLFEDDNQKNTRPRKKRKLSACI